MPKDMLDKVGGSWVKLLVIAVIGLGSGGSGGVWLANAQPRSDEDIREIAAREVAAESRVTKVELKNIKDDVSEVKDDVKEILRRLPVPN